MTRRSKSIQSLLTKAESQLQIIEEKYNRSLQTKVVDDMLRIEIKNACENMRSALDYLAQDISERFCPGRSPKDRFYFPILPNKKEFDSKIELCFPGLRQTSPEMSAILERIQPFQAGYEWLGQFNRINNENKHGNLVQQTRTERPETRVTSQHGGQVSWTSGVTFSKGVSVMGVPIDPETQLPVPNPSISVTRITWVDFQFSGIGVSAIGLLKKSLLGIRDIEAEIRPYI